MIYLDYNATTPIDPRVFQAMEPFLRSSSERYGNPSSGHRIGQNAKEGIERSRNQVASLLGCSSSEVIFTSGGTESDNLAISGYALAHRDKGDHIITSQIEHDAVLNTCRNLEKTGFQITFLPVNEKGCVDLDEMVKEITENTILISIMHANNEVGAIQPLREIGEIARERGIAFHTDAVQAVGKIETKVDEIGCDLLSLSAHKIYGPKGVGVLYVRSKDGKPLPLHPLFHGGPHERGIRAGTENVPGIAGLGQSCEIALTEMDEEGKRLRRLRERLIVGFRKEGFEFAIHGDLDHALPGTLNLSIPEIEGEALLQALDLEGICVSTGAACESGSIEPSHVLLAMGVPREVAKRAIRISLGRMTHEEEIDRAIKIFSKIVDRLLDI